MKVIIKFFAPGQTRPDFVGEIQPVPTLPVNTELTPEQARRVFQIEQGFNESSVGRCHIEVTS